MAIIYKSNILQINDLQGIYPSRSPLLVPVTPYITGSTVKNQQTIAFNATSFIEGDRLVFAMSDGSTRSFIFVLQASLNIYDVVDGDTLIPLKTDSSADINMLHNIRQLDKAIDSVMTECESIHTGNKITVTYNRYTQLFDNCYWEGTSGVAVVYTQFSTTNTILAACPQARCKMYLFRYDNAVTAPVQQPSNATGQLINTKIIDYVPGATNLFNLNDLSLTTGGLTELLVGSNTGTVINQFSFYYIIQLESPGQGEFEVYRSSDFNVIDAISPKSENQSNDNYYTSRYMLDLTGGMQASDRWAGRTVSRPLVAAADGSINFYFGSVVYASQSKTVTYTISYLNRQGYVLNQINRIITVYTTAPTMMQRVNYSTVPDNTSTITVVQKLGSASGITYSWRLLDGCRFRGQGIHLIDVNGIPGTWQMWGESDIPKYKMEQTTSEKPITSTGTNLYYPRQSVIRSDVETEYTLHSGWRQVATTQQAEEFDNMLQDLQAAKCTWMDDGRYIQITSLSVEDGGGDSRQAKITFKYI